MKGRTMTREIEKTIRGADPSLDLRVCVEHGSIFIHPGCFDSRRCGQDELSMNDPAQAGGVIVALQDARRILAGNGGPD
jgi:hypothetical protein